MAAMGVGEYVVGMPQFNNETQMQTLPPLVVTEAYPLASSISMIAPSPDWFSGFYEFSVADGGLWLADFAIETYPWDAGTEDGDTFSQDNAATDPQIPIFQLTIDTVPDNGVFLSPDTTTVLPVARWQCTMMMDSGTEMPVTNGGSFTIVSTEVSEVNIEDDAEYECTFENLWSGATHPVDYPSDAHWSPPVLAAHSGEYSMWGPAEMATPGVELVAEVSLSQ
jgi:hypothetical protein